MRNTLNISRRAVLALAALSAIGFSPAAAGEVKPIDASRLVTIGGAVTEIVYEIGFGDKVVGRDTPSYYPDAVNKVPDVGYMRALSPEGVLSVSPTAILMIEGSGPQTAIDVLAKAEVPVVAVPEG